MNWGRERPAWGRPAVSEDGILLERRPSVACSGAGLATQKSSARTDNALGADVPLDPRKKRTVLQSRDASHDSGPPMPFLTSHFWPR